MRTIRIPTSTLQDVLKKIGNVHDYISNSHNGGRTKTICPVKRCRYNMNIGSRCCGYIIRNHGDPDGLCSECINMCEYVKEVFTKEGVL